MKTTHIMKTEIDAKKTIYAMAERQARIGKRFVYGGFVVSILGVVTYCLACFWVGLNQKVDGVLYDHPGWLLMPTLGAIGLGTLLWLVGSLLHLKGAMNGDPNESEF